MEWTWTWRWTCFTLMLLLLTFSLTSRAQFTFPDGASQPVGLHVDGNGRVFVAAGNQLFRLGSDFGLEENVTLASEVVGTALSADESAIVVCTGDDTCGVYNTSDLAGGASDTRPSSEDGETASSLALFASSNESFYLGTATTGGQQVFELRHYGYGNSANITRVERNRITVSTTVLVRNFYTGFVSGGYAYYFVVDSGSERGLRVLRVCDTSQCSGDPCGFDAHYEGLLFCGSSPLTGTQICDVSLLSGFGGSTELTVVVTLCRARNRVCSYKLSDINDLMDTQRNNCANNIIMAPLTTSEELGIAWDISTSSSTCTGFTAPSACSLSRPLGTPRIDPFIARVSVVLSVSSQIESAVAIRVEDTSLLYVGFDGFLRGYGVDEVTGVATAQFLQQSSTSTVRQLEWREDSDYIFVASDDSVSRFRIEECSSFDTCDSCQSDGNPLCGWCTVENKCSRRSQCSNATDPASRRWLQGADQCIRPTLQPSQIIISEPEIITVTLGPVGLPVPLPGESYSCLFTSGASSISVPAVEVTPNTTYTCNITGDLPTFTGVQLLSTFNFVSSLSEIPFGVAENPFVIYECPRATSCSECLQTNACGWCLYEKTCSGTSAPCMDSANFLQANGSSYTDVCPLLLAGPSAAGDYPQPVVLPRDITLSTSNLPPVISGFQYVCEVGSATLSSTINNNSITCQVDRDQLQSSAPTDLRSVRILWRSTDGLVQHPIDTITGDNINVNLYNCEKLSEACSTCLGTEFDCGWCDTSSVDTCRVPEDCAGGTFNTQSNQCPTPTLSNFSPASGPPQGGTRITIRGIDLGVSFSDVNGSVTVGGIPCITDENGYVPGEVITCETGTFTGDGVTTIIVTLDRQSGPGQASDGPFNVTTPSISGVSPRQGPRSGGTLVTIQGTDLDIGNIEETSITLREVPCIVQQSLVTYSEIKCIVDALVDTIGSGPIVLNVDNAEIDSVNKGIVYEFQPDPVFMTINPQATILSGGTTLTFSGTFLDVVQNPTFQVTDRQYMDTPATPCTVINFNSMSCLTPRLISAGKSRRLVATAENISYTVVVDNAAGPDFSNPLLQLNVLPDPVIGDLSDVVASNVIGINGSNLDSVPLSEYRVTVGGEPCEIVSINEEGTQLFCRPPVAAPGGASSAVIIVFIGQNLTTTLSQELQYQSEQQLPVMTIALAAGVGGGGLILIMILIILCVVCVATRKSREKDKKFTNLMQQMDMWELEMADECKRAFTELQTDLADLVQISAADKNLPYRDFRSFAMCFLFPSATEVHPVLQPLRLPEKSDRDHVMHQLSNFQKLLMDRKFLLVMVRALEAQQGRFNLQDKCNVASLLMVCFQNDLDYATEVLQTLLSELMRKTVTKSHPKLLLRRTESVAEKMLANWLSFLLFPYILDHAGEPLFILFRAIKSQLEKGPVDVITGEARHSLSEEKLLRQHLEVKIIEGVVETDGGEMIPIKLLDCDSITQSKEKVLDALYRNTPVSKRPQLTDVDLELWRQTAGVPLRDQDATNVREGEWTRVNTLGHYKLAEMSQAYIANPRLPPPKFRVVRRSFRPMSMNIDTLGTIVANAGASRMSMLNSGESQFVYHLVKPEAVENIENGPGKEKRILTEVFLTRLLSTKRILQPYVDDLFKAIFTVPRGKPLPKAIKCLFDFLDLQAAELGIQDPEILHTWKTNSLPLRFWVNLIKNPDFVFDIHKSATVDSCLTVVAQAYIDACSTAEMKYNKDTPSSKLLYLNEVKGYKAGVQHYYTMVQSLPKLDPHEMSEYLRETAQVCASCVPEHAAPEGEATTRQLYFVTESALFELFKYAARYCTEVVDALEEEGLSSMAMKLDTLVKELHVK